MGGNTMKYYSLDNILSKNFDINILIGERSNGKSYAVKYECLKKAYKEHACTFGIIRRYDSDIKTQLVESYFADAPVRDITNNEYSQIVVYRGGIYFANMDEDGAIKRGFQCGNVFALALDERYKSTEYPNMSDLIYEEFVTKGRYLTDEPMRFMNLISTIFRRRKGRVFMICNTISRVCPYYVDFQLTHIKNQKIGTIDSYEFTDIAGKVTRIGVEYCANTGAKTSGLFFGKFGRQIDGGAWECKEYPKLSGDLSEYNQIYKLSLVHMEFKFNILLLTKDGTMLAYVYPATLKTNDRILTEEYSDSMMITPCLYRNRKPELYLNLMWTQNKFVYSDNLTGEDFNTTIKNMAKHPFSVV